MKGTQKTKTKPAGKVIRKGDKVMAITGDYKGKTGTVIRRYGDKATVTGLNLKKKHVRKTQENPKGGIVEIEKPMHISNLVICDSANKPVKIRTRTNKEGEKELYYLDNGKEVFYRNVKKTS